MINIKGFPNYKFDQEKDLVVTLFNKKSIEYLKWYTGPKGTIQRVTLFQDGKKNYLYKKSIINLLETSSDDFDQKWQKVLDFFKNERNGKKMRKDQFQAKFGKEFLEECLEKELLNIIKIGNFYFYDI